MQDNINRINTNQQKIQDLLGSAKNWINENGTAINSDLTLIKMDIISLNDLDQINEELRLNSNAGEKIAQVTKLINNIHINYNTTIERCDRSKMPQFLSNTTSSAKMLTRSWMFESNKSNNKQSLFTFTQTLPGSGNFRVIL